MILAIHMTTSNGCKSSPSNPTDSQFPTHSTLFSASSLPREVAKPSAASPAPISRPSPLPACPHRRLRLLLPSGHCGARRSPSSLPISLRPASARLHRRPMRQDPPLLGLASVRLLHRRPPPPSLRPLPSSSTVRLLSLVMSSFFWNGNRSTCFDPSMEEYTEVPSDIGIAFNLQPKMKASEIAEKAREAIRSHKYNQNM
ncbi:hypothetical protein Taro_028573 [Colocasia esculenta]|uniref:Metalloenzyme domain-containing protein n=1 Tax=Colocasia esculenta TaxID=4460 RepID=A0A843VGT1_COLES|nr:hypothetical protein [Colocasia esculenta]